MKYFIFVLLAVIVIIWLTIASVAHAHDTDPVVTEWYKTLMQPDNPHISCCGEADAYWCDDYFTKAPDPRIANDKPHNFCKITDDRPDYPLHRPHINVGTIIEIPNHKMKYDQGNPTGHSVIFLSPGNFVFCFVLGSGI